MEKQILKFPHIVEKIYGELDNESLVKCKEVSLPWNHFLETNKAYNWQVIKGYTNCSDALMKKLAKNKTEAIKIVSDLHEIFKKFPRGTRQSSRFIKTWFNSPLHVAAENGYLKAYQLIMENIMDKNPLSFYDATKYSFIHVNSLFATPLHLAARKGHFNICEFIFENIRGKTTTDHLKITPFHSAAENGHFLICQLFIVKNEDKNSKTMYGWTPLHFAAASGHLKVCKLLTEAIEVTNMKDYWGYNPLDLAIKFDHLHVKKHLEEVGFISNEMANHGFGVWNLLRGPKLVRG